jgi:uncharacterized protein YjbI with pentapeptide repeats
MGLHASPCASLSAGHRVAILLPHKFFRENKLISFHWFQRSDVQHADMKRADMQRADMQRADMQRADVQRADSSWATREFLSDSLNFTERSHVLQLLIL